MDENMYLAVHFEGSPLKKLVSTYVSDEFGEPLSDWSIASYPNKNSVTGWELSDMLEEMTERIDIIRSHRDNVPLDLLNGRLVRGVVELLTVPGYRLVNAGDGIEFRHVDPTAGFEPVQSIGGEVGRLTVVAPLVKETK